MDPYIGEIRIFAGNFAPRGWQLCNGQLLPIANNEVLYTVIGTTYGGDGVTTFAVPNLQGSVPIGEGQGAGLTSRALGATGGASEVTLTVAEMPGHSHTVNCGAASTQTTADASSVWADGTGAGRGVNLLYGPAPDGNTTMNPAAVMPAGQSLPHSNVQPSLTVNFIIAIEGIFPSPN